VGFAQSHCQNILALLSLMIRDIASFFHSYIDILTNTDITSKFVVLVALA